MWTIYKITNNINNKSYIGQTMRKPAERWREHKSHANTEQTPLARAIQKYGWDNFTKEIIDTAKTAKEADEKEKYWIEYYQTCIQKFGKNAGYNITPGGEGVIRITEKQEQLIMSLWNEKYSLTDIGKILHIDRHTVRDTLYRLGINEENFLYGNNRKYCVIYEYNRKGELLNIFHSIKEVTDYYPNISNSTLHRVLRHEDASTNGSIFLYEEDLLELPNHIERSNKTPRNLIKATNIMTGEEVIYSSFCEAEKITGIHRKTIRNRALKGIIKDNIKWEKLDKNPCECTIDQVK